MEREFDREILNAIEQLLNLTRQSHQFANTLRSPRLAGNIAVRAAFKKIPDRSESDVEHSFHLQHLAKLAKLLLPKLDEQMFLNFARVHDMLEMYSENGDYNSFIASSEVLGQKAQEEIAAIDKWRQVEGAEDWLETVEIYERLTNDDQEIQAVARANYGEAAWFAAMATRAFDKLTPDATEIVYIENAGIGAYLEHMRTEYGICTTEELSTLMDRAKDRFKRRFSEDFPNLLPILDCLQWVLLNRVREDFNNRPVLF